MRRICLATALALCGCSSSTAPKARAAGKVMAIGGVAGLIATAFAAGYLGDRSRPIIAGFSMMSGIGIGTYAAGDLSRSDAVEETQLERHHRWARILTERAYGYAREGRCPRVRHIETRVLVYDREFHDFVFMRDPAISKCLNPIEPTPEVPAQSVEITNDLP